MKIYILRITDKSSINAHELYISPTIKISAGGWRDVIPSVILEVCHVIFERLALAEAWSRDSYLLQY